MIEWSNLNAISYGDSTMHLKEVNVILAVLDELLKEPNRADAVGSFALHCQAYNSSCIYDHAAVVAAVVGNPCCVSETCKNIVNTSIHEALEWPAYDSRFWQHFSNNFLQIAGQHYPKTRIYREGKLIVLIVNATHGRFLASLVLRRNNPELATGGREILRALAVAIARLSLQDEFLRSGVDDGIVSGNVTAPIRYVHRLFDECELSALNVWEKWVTQHIEIADTLFFRRTKPFPAS